MGLGEALSIGSALAWAGSVIAYTRLGETLPPARLNLLKNLLVLAMMVPTVLVVHGLTLPGVPPLAIVLAVASGTLGIAVADTLYFRALNTLGASHMGIVGNLYSPVVIVLSFAFLGERLGPVQIAGFVLVTAGVLVISQNTSVSRPDVRRRRIGVLYGAASITLMAIAIVMIKRVLETQPLLWVVLLRVIGGVLGMLALFLWRRESLVPDAALRARIRWPLLLLAAFLGQYLSMVLWLGGYKYTEASIAAILNESSSVFIVLLAVPFLGEGLSRRKLLGVGLTVAGVACMLLG